MNVLLDADLEDIQHIPEFKEVIDLLVDNYQKIFDVAEDKQQKEED